MTQPKWKNIFILVIVQAAFTTWEDMGDKITPHEIKEKRKRKKKGNTKLGCQIALTHSLHLFSIYSTVISSIVVSLGFLYLLSSKEEHTTLIEDKAMQAPAAHGGNLIPREG